MTSATGKNSRDESGSQAIQASLSQTFRETAAVAYAAFPQELENLVVLVTSADEAVFIAPGVAKKLAGDTQVIREAARECEDYMRERGWPGLADSPFHLLPGTDVKMIALRPRSAGGKIRREDIFFLDHEIGHHILRNGYDGKGISRQKAESAADAFAMLRYIQRFGMDTYVHFSAYNKPANIILAGDTEHYTSKALQRVIDVAKERDISGLSLQDTARLAEDIADECALTDKTLRKMRRAFNRAHRHLDKKLGGQAAVIGAWLKNDKKAYPYFCRETLDVMKKHWRDPDVFEAGRLFLGNRALQKFMHEAAETDVYWRSALTFIDNPAALVRRKFLRFRPQF